MLSKAKATGLLPVLLHLFLLPPLVIVYLNRIPELFADATASNPKLIAQQAQGQPSPSSTPTTGASSSTTTASASAPLLFDLSESMAAKLPDLEKLKARIEEKNAQIGTLKSQVRNQRIFFCWLFFFFFCEEILFMYVTQVETGVKLLKQLKEQLVTAVDEIRVKNERLNAMKNSIMALEQEAAGAKERENGLRKELEEAREREKKIEAELAALKATAAVCVRFCLCVSVYMCLYASTCICAHVLSSFPLYCVCLFRTRRNRRSAQASPPPSPTPAPAPAPTQTPLFAHDPEKGTASILRSVYLSVCLSKTLI